MNNTNKVALITGASRGIGRELACFCAEKGYDVIAVARDYEKLGVLQKELESHYGITCRVVAVDVCDSEVMATAIESAVADAGRLDVLINSAGIFLDDDRVVDSDNFAKQLSTNVIAVQKITNMCTPVMKRAGAGYIINISSITGVQGYRGIADYCASKHALVGYSTSLSQSLKKHGIKVSVLCPDVVDTDMSASSPLTAEEKIQLDDMVKAVDFLLSLSPSAIVEQLVIGV